MREPTDEERRVLNDIGKLLGISCHLTRIDFDMIVKHLCAAPNQKSRAISDNLVLIDLAQAFKSVLPFIREWQKRGESNHLNSVNANKN